MDAVCFIPVHGLEIGMDVGGELQVGRVRLLNRERIPRVRARLGVPKRLSEYASSHGPLLQGATTFAHVVSNRAGGDRDLSEERRLVEEVLWLIAASALGRERRGRYEFGLRPSHAGGLVQTGVVLEGTGQSSFAMHERIAPVEPYRIDKEFYSFVARRRFKVLLAIATGRSHVEPGWAEQVRGAAILAGRSYLARHVMDAFMFDMIAIESLLTVRGDKFPAALFERLNTVFGWLDGDENNIWEKAVRRLYELRCSYVHDGDGEHIEFADLFNADTILANLLVNVCLNHRRIRSKEDLVQHARVLNARKILNRKLRLAKTDRWIFTAGSFGKSELKAYQEAFAKVR